MKDNPTPHPWYREPWPWVLIAIPLLTVVIASAITFWLAVSHPDHTVVEDAEYQKIKAELRAQENIESDSSQDDD